MKAKEDSVDFSPLSAGGDACCIFGEVYLEPETEKTTEMSSRCVEEQSKNLIKIFIYSSQFYFRRSVMHVLSKTNERIETCVWTCLDKVGLSSAEIYPPLIHSCSGVDPERQTRHGAT